MRNDTNKIRKYGQNQFSYFFCNDFYRCYHGFQFAGPAAIPSQLDFFPSPTPTNNGWYLRPANNSDLAGQITPSFPQIHWYYSGTGSAAFPTTLNLLPFSINNDAPTFTSNSNPVCAVPQFQGPGGGNRNSVFGPVVRNENSYDPGLEEYKLMEEEIAMASFFRDSSLVYAGLPDDSLYVGFLSSRILQRQGKYAGIQKAIETGNFNNAYLSLNLLQPASLKEQWYLDVNEKIIRYFAFDSSFNTNDTAAIYSIAFENSVFNGVPVHQARAALKLDIDDVFQQELRSVSNTNEENADELALKVYPNPGTGPITIETELTFHQLRIYSIDGRLIRDVSLGEQTAFSFTHNLEPGNYLLEVIFTDESRKGVRITITQ